MGRKKIEIIDGQRQCKVCGMWKDLSQFRNKQAKCKPCQDKYQKEYYENNRDRILEHARNYNKQRRIAKRFDYDYVLNQMIDGMIYRGKKTTGRYADVPCQWTSIPDARRDIQQDKRLIAEFDAQYLKYAKSKNPDDVPSIHRKDNSKGYFLDNITIIGWGEHRQLDICKAVDVFCLDTWTIKRLPRKKDAKAEFGTLDMLDKGISFSPDGMAYIIQSASVTDDKSKLADERYPDMTRDEITARIKAKLEQSRVVVESLKQRA